MEILLWLLMWLAKGVLILITLLLIALAVFIQVAQRQVLKFQMELPWLKWLTLEQVVQMGFSRFWARLILPVFYKHGNLEVRLIDEDGMDDYEHELVHKFGFDLPTVPLYEFRLTKRSRRKKFNWMSLLPSLRPALAPARV